jgi:hypothetical protein
LAWAGKLWVWDGADDLVDVAEIQGRPGVVMEAGPCTAVEMEAIANLE